MCLVLNCLLCKPWLQQSPSQAWILDWKSFLFPGLSFCISVRILGDAKGNYIRTVCTLWHFLPEAQWIFIDKHLYICYMFCFFFYISRTLKLFLTITSSFTIALYRKVLSNFPLHIESAQFRIFESCLKSGLEEL